MLFSIVHVVLFLGLSLDIKADLYIVGAAGSGGQLGLDITPARMYSPTLINKSLIPWKDSPVTLIAPGQAHHLILAGGTVYSLGYNADGQLGVGNADILDNFQTLTGSSAPWGKAAVTGLAASDRSVVIAGGDAYVFGANHDGQLGLGHLDPVYRPKLLSGPWQSAIVSRVALGGLHTLLLAGGQVYTFGDNTYLQCGFNSSVSQLLRPRMLNGQSAPWQNGTVTSIAAGLHHSVVIAGGQVYTFGLNLNCQLGLGDYIEAEFPMLVDGVDWGAGGITAVGGAFYTLFLAGGQVYGCGDNLEGYLGLNETNDYCIPTMLTGAPWSPSVVTAIAAGGCHSVVLAGRNVYTFGINSWGQLGIGNATIYSSWQPLLLPLSLPSGQYVQLVAAHMDTTVVVTGADVDYFSPSPSALPSPSSSPSQRPPFSPSPSSHPVQSPQTKSTVDNKVSPTLQANQNPSPTANSALSSSPVMGSMRGYIGRGLELLILEIIGWWWVMDWQAHRMLANKR